MTDDRTRVVVTGLGVVSPAGLRHGALWTAAAERRSCIRPITRFDATTFGCRRAGELADFAAEEFVDRRVIKQTDRGTHLGMAACSIAVKDAAIDLAAIDRRELGMYFGNVFGGMEFAEPELFAQTFLGPSRVSAYQSIAWFYAATQGQWSIAHDVRGIGKTLVGDSAGGLQALLLGMKAIRQGHATWMLAGGFEAPLAPYVFAIHESSGRLAVGDAAYAPFDRRAAGTILAEAACVLLLETLESALRRGVRIYAELAGGAMNIDAGPGAHDDTGAGLATCIEEALEDAEVGSDDVAHVLPDATGIRELDARDVRAMAHVFRHCGDLPPVGTHKAVIGHALAAAGPLDAAWAAMMLHAGTHVDGCAPPAPIAEPGLRFARGGARLEGNAILCFGSGWQGLNAAILLRRHGD